MKIHKFSRSEREAVSFAKTWLTEKLGILFLDSNLRFRTYTRLFFIIFSLSKTLKICETNPLVAQGESSF